MLAQSFQRHEEDTCYKDNIFQFEKPDLMNSVYFLNILFGDYLIQMYRIFNRSISSEKADVNGFHYDYKTWTIKFTCSLEADSK